MNLVLFNAREKRDPNGLKNKRYDEMMFTEICNRLDFENPHTVTIFRLGKKSVTDRPRKVIMTNKSERKYLLDNAKHIPEKLPQSLKSVIITKDLTTKQRQKRKERRLELKSKENNPHSDVGKKDANTTVVTNYRQTSIGETQNTGDHLYLSPIKPINGSHLIAILCMAEGGVGSMTKFRGGHSSLALCVDSTPNGSQIVSGGENGELCVWNRRGELTQKLQTEQADCTSVYVSRVKENTVYAAFGNSVKVLDARNLSSVVESFQFNEDEINQIVANDKECKLAACDDSGEVRIISLEDKKLYKTLRRKHTNLCSTVCFRAKHSHEIFSGGMDCNLIHWDFTRPKCKNMFNMQELQDSPSELGAYMVNPPFVHHLAASGDGKFLACGLENGLVSIFDTSKKNVSEIFSMHAHTQGVSQVYFISDSKLISGGNDCNIALWDLSKMYDSNEAGQVPQSNGHTSPIHTRNAEMTDNCRVLEIHHTSKINWMKHFVFDGTTYIVIADMTEELTSMPLPV